MRFRDRIKSQHILTGETILDWTAIRVTLSVAACTTALLFVLGLPLAAWLAAELPGYRRRVGRDAEAKRQARIAELRAEIARLEADIGRKQATRSAADQFFKK